MENKGQNKGENGMQCVEFDARLADVLDGVMSGAELEAFKAHAAACIDCGPLFTQAQVGMQALKSLVEVEPPVNLFHNIIAKTSAIDPAMAPTLAQAKQSWLGRWLGGARQWAGPVLNPIVHVISQPRLAMTTAMAFFSFSLVLNLAGVKMSDFRNVDLRPSAITTTASVQYHLTTAKVVKYYENIRFVYQLESRMKELTKDQPKSDSNSDQNGDKKEQKQPDNTSQKPGSDNKNYALGEGEEVLAVLRFDALPGCMPRWAQENGRNS